MSCPHCKKFELAESNRFLVIRLTLDAWGQAALNCAVLAIFCHILDLPNIIWLYFLVALPVLANCFTREICDNCGAVVSDTTPEKTSKFRQF